MAQVNSTIEKGVAQWSASMAKFDQATGGAAAGFAGFTSEVVGDVGVVSGALDVLAAKMRAVQMAMSSFIPSSLLGSGAGMAGGGFGGAMTADMSAMQR